MDKPRIIIADTDINYIIPLQQKFIEEYFEKIDLEIICDQSYFEQLFLKPQKVDILIISENLYTSAIHRHDIGNLFLMTEHYHESQSGELNVNQIYKYTSIKEIFGIITGKGYASLESSVTKKRETQIILVDSACGGVGKTTIALGISACLNKEYKRVLYINTAHLQTFQWMLSNPSPITESDIYTKLIGEHDDVYSEIKHVIRNEGFSYIPPFQASLMSLGIPYTIFENIAVSAKKAGDYDYIIIDTDTDFDEDKARMIDIADKVIVVTKQNKAAVYATNVLLTNINGTSSDKYIFVCNDFEQKSNNVLISSQMKKKFSVSAYIEHLSNCDELKASDLVNVTDMGKITFLIM